MTTTTMTMNGGCHYVVTYVPPGCTTFYEGQEVVRPCDEQCQDLVIMDGGPCDGTYLMVVLDGCL
jgi:hypothetical protein